VISLLPVCGLPLPWAWGSCNSRIVEIPLARARCKLGGPFSWPAPLVGWFDCYAAVSAVWGFEAWQTSKPSPRLGAFDHGPCPALFRFQAPCSNFFVEDSSPYAILAAETIDGERAVVVVLHL
jgi:hypothetical protein